MKFRLSLAAFLAGCVFAFPAAADAPDVVTSIKPIHSLVAQVMQGVGEPDLLVDGAASPHTYSLKPSDAAALEGADLIFWVGEALEPFLEKSVETLGANATVVELSQAQGLHTLPYREGGPFEADGHDNEHHDDAADHAGGDHQHEADDHHGEAGHDAHHHGGIDMHLWLDPRNARAMIAAIAAALSAEDPANAERYAENAQAAAAELERLEAEIAVRLAPFRERPFVVFHDAYQYFENRFGLNAAGSITVSPEVAPGAQRVAEIREKVSELGAVCVFAEPQFEPAIVRTITEGTQARSGVLDPEGADIPNGPELYATLLTNMAASLEQCLSGAD